jgi:dipeptidyl-peptidase-3
MLAVAVIGVGGVMFGYETKESTLPRSSSLESTDTKIQERPPVHSKRKYLLERVGEAAVVQLYADGFSGLPLNQKILIWHLYQAALAGRDIFYDQRYRYNLVMREVLEEILTHSRDVKLSTRKEIERYTKLFWLNTGPYNNLTGHKFTLNCTLDEFLVAAKAAARVGAVFPFQQGEDLYGLLNRLEPMFFDESFEPTVLNKTAGSDVDILSSSANNLYVDVTIEDLENFDERHPLNSRLVKRDGKLFEEVYKIGGRYSDALENISKHLEAAIPYATEAMKVALEALLKVYLTGSAVDRRAYDIAWVKDKDSFVDTINGFVEVYADARGMKGSWEALVFYVNEKKTKGIQRLAEDAQWFEDRMPWEPRYRKHDVQGITAKAIDVVIETGDSGPITPLGINLPNDQEVRESYGSKSVSLSNVAEAYEQSMPMEYRHEFSWTEAEVARAEKFGSIASELQTNMHEVIGHASGKLSEHLDGNPAVFLREQYSGLEEARAELVALYFISNPRLVALGLVTAENQETIALTQYESFTRNVLVQLRRVRQGTRLEQDHMRARQLIVSWLTDRGEAIEVRNRQGKTYYVVTNPEAFQMGVGCLLSEIQRIKSEGDYEMAKKLFEQYGTHFDPLLRDEVVSRVDLLNLPSYTGFVQPKLAAVFGDNDAIVDVEISYPADLTTQMLEYSGKRP